MTTSSAEALAATQPSLDIGIGGMTCATCASRVERALQRVPGVRSATVNLATESARIIYTPGEPMEALLRRAVRDAGYEPRAAEEGTLDPQLSAWPGFGPVALGLLLSAPLVLPMLASLWGVHWMLSPGWQFLLATPVQFILGARFYVASWHALKARAGNMDLLVAMGTTAGWALSVWLWLTAPPDAMVHLYFEGSAVVITLVRLGKWLEAQAKRQTTSAIRALHALRPQMAHLMGPEGERDVPAAEVLVGDSLAVKPGERIPADGVVVEGRSEVDESLLTGEPMPVLKFVGASLTAGAINGQGRLVMQVKAIGDATQLSFIIRLVEDAQIAKAPIQKLVDRVSAVFIPAVLGIAVVTLLGCLLAGYSFEVALIRCVSVLVIACPCALGLATPAALVAGTGVAARNGILIKDVQVLETAHKVTLVAFDKTGTLTQGRPVLSHLVHCVTTLDEEVLYLAASLQSGSEHPLAQAVLKLADEKGVKYATARDIQTWPGMGCEGQVDGRRVLVGNVRWLLSQGVAAGGWIDQAQSLQSLGATVSGVMDCGSDAPVVLALLIFGDDPKVESRKAIDALQMKHIRTVMVTGDNEPAARIMATRLGLQPNADEVIANALPEDKVAVVRAFQKDGFCVAMVGDGINDAPALAAADVSMAMANPGGGGSDVASHVAGITLMRGDPRLVPAALDISRRTVSKIRQNLFWALIYNVAGIPLAALGYLNPVVAGAAMALSSVCVMGNALLLKFWRP
jgi:Cu+-exporting ATPase